MKKVITIEDAFRYHPHLLVRPSIDLSNRRTSSLSRKGIGSVQALKEESDAENPGRMELVEMDSFTWEAYTEAAKHIQDVPTVPWEERESSLFAINSYSRLIRNEVVSQRMITCSLRDNYRIIDMENNCSYRL